MTLCGFTVTVFTRLCLIFLYYYLLIAVRNIALSNWSSVGGLATQRAYMGSATVGLQVFFGGGFISASSDTASVEMLDMSTGLWTGKIL